MNNNDGNGWCQCERCRALDPPAERTLGRVSTRFYTFINTVADRVLQQRPKARLWGWAYQAFQHPPTAARPDPRLAVLVALHGRCYRHSVGDPACQANRKMRDILTGWSAMVRTLGSYDYYSCFVDWRGGDDRVTYLPMERVVAADIRYLHRLGARVWRVEVPPPDGKFGPVWNKMSIKENWRASFQQYYVMAKLLWNPTQDVDALLSDLNAKFYGPAAGPMGRYRALLYERWTRTPGHAIYGVPYEAIGRCLAAPGAEKQLLDYLAQAEAAAHDRPDVLARIAKDRQYFGLCWQRTYRMYQQRPTGDIAVARRRGPIKIDGVVDEADWRTCDYVTGFRHRIKGPAKHQTFVRLLYDDHALYMAVEDDEPQTDKLTMHCRTRDGKVWQDDDVELFIDPEGAGTRYVHIVVNPAGTIYDADCKLGSPYDVAFTTRCEVATQVLAKKWVLEMRIDAASLGTTIRDGARWRMNVARARRVGGVREFSSWADGTFHQPDSFRTVVFAQALVRNGGFEEVIDLKNPALMKRYGRKGWQYGNTPPQLPRFWNLHGGHPGTATVVTRDARAGRRAWQIDNGWVQQALSGPIAVGAKLGVQFWAKGTGTLTVAVYQYKRDAGGSRRFHKTRLVGKATLGQKWKRYEWTYTRAPDEPADASLAFWVKGSATLDDVYVTARD